MPAQDSSSYGFGGAAGPAACPSRATRIGGAPARSHSLDLPSGPMSVSQSRLETVAGMKLLRLGGEGGASDQHRRRRAGPRARSTRSRARETVTASLHHSGSLADE